MRYGLPYQGSKSKIAKWVIDNLPPASTFVDLFAGGCAVTHAAMSSGKYQRFIANDTSEAPEVFQRAIAGEFKSYGVVPTREEFYASNDFVLRLLYSFGNNQKDYLWSEELETLKVPASRMLSASSLHERRMYYRQFIHTLSGTLTGKNTQQIAKILTGSEDSRDKSHGLQGLQGLERLERLAGLEGLERLERLEVSRLDYSEVAIPTNAIVYADPPYKGTNCTAYAGFDFARFDTWLAQTSFMVVISGYNCPAGCVEVANTQRACTMSATGVKSTVERLFVHERWGEEYRRLMEPAQLRIAL